MRNSLMLQVIQLHLTKIFSSIFFLISLLINFFLFLLILISFVVVASINLKYFI